MDESDNREDDADVDASAGDASATDAASADPASAVDDPSLLADLEQFDYSQYELPELRDSIEVIVDVPGFFVRVTLAGFVLFAATIFWLFCGKGWLTFGAAVVLGMLVSLLLAMLLAFTLSLRRLLTEVHEVLDEMFEISGNILRDAGNSGDVNSDQADSDDVNSEDVDSDDGNSDDGNSADEGTLATLASIFGGVSRNLVLPIAESVVRARLGWAARPLLWLHRRLLVRTVDIATSRILFAASKVTLPGVDFVSEQIGGTLKAGAGSVDPLLAAIRPYVVGSVRKVVFCLLLPAWTLLTLAIASTVVACWAALAYT